MAKRTREKSCKVLEYIRSEDDLLPFRLGDPFCLHSDIHGNARFAYIQHMWRAGMFPTIAEWDEQPAGYPISQLRSFRNGHTVTGVISWPHEGHRLIVGAPGSGKFTAAIAPMLLTDDQHNAFVIDPKDGEAFRHTAVYRNALGDGKAPGVRILDGSGLYASHIASESLNPLDLIHPDNPNLVGDADKLVDALVITSGEEKEPFWVESAKKLLRALIIHVATYPSCGRQGATPTLMDVQRILSEDIDDDILREMAQNPVADGLVERQALEVSALKKTETTWRGIKVQVDTSFRFLDNPRVRATLGETTFDIRALRSERLSLYVVLANKDKTTLQRWLRLVYTTVIDQIDTTPGRPVHVVVDEFPSLRQFDRVLTDLATMRSADLKFHLAVQDLNQLNQLYGHGWQTIVGNCAVRQILGVNDNFTADYVSRMLGQTTILDGFDYQQEYPDHPPKKRPRFVGRDLMTPAEVLSMDREMQIVFADRCPRPIKMHKTEYYRHWREYAIDLLMLEPPTAA